MIKTVNHCVGCPTCSGLCNLAALKVECCDFCGEEIWDVGYYIDGSVACEDCLMKNIDEVTEEGEVCEECGSDDEKLYMVEMQILCKNCAKDSAKRYF